MKTYYQLANEWKNSNINISSLEIGNCVIIAVYENRKNNLGLYSQISDESCRLYTQYRNKETRKIQNSLDKLLKKEFDSTNVIDDIFKEIKEKQKEPLNKTNFFGDKVIQFAYLTPNSDFKQLAKIIGRAFGNLSENKFENTNNIEQYKSFNYAVYDKLSKLFGAL